MALDFVHLHVHSDFSLLDGAASIKKIVQTVKENGQTAAAITDHGNMFGVLLFFRECKAQGIKPLIGSEFYVAPESRFDKTEQSGKRKYHHLILIAKNETGYKNLMKLSSKSYTEGMYYKPRIDDELLEMHSEGIICLSACLAGKLPSLLLAGKEKEAEEHARKYLNIFGDGHYYIELQNHGLEEQKKVSPLLINLAKRLGIPMVVTNDAHYALKEDYVAQDILMCIGMKKTRNDQNRMKFSGSEFYLKSTEEMAELFPDYPEMLTNTVRIAEMCSLEIPKPGPLLPIYQIPEEFKNNEEYIEHLVQDGLKKRYKEVTPEIKERAEYELGIIKKMGFVGYFLIVWDFIDWAKNHDIPVGPGRGSGAGSIVAYALRITDIDPLKYNLLFERFLNPERVSMPDFDVDFCFERRQEVIEYVREKYGDDNVGQIITFGTLKPKAAIKDVGRVLNIDLPDVVAITKLIPSDPKITLEKAFKEVPELDALRNDIKYKELLEISSKLEDAKRNTSLHAAGIVIGQSELMNYVPLYKDSKTGKIATQFTMDLIEDCGLVKMDFLGLKTLTLIKHTEELVRKRGGEFKNFFIKDISYEDKKTFEMLGEGLSVAVFQFESSGMQNVLRRVKPDKVEDLIALNALYRPGPMDNIDQFVKSKWDKSKIKYPDPCLESILSETYGVIVYQEQVMQVAQKIAGYTLGQADILRRAMGKKKKEVMEEERIKFTEGALAKGFSKETAERIFDLLIPFAGYGFNKSHAAVYSVLAYQTAYLKAHFTPEFMAANLTNEMNSVDKLPEYIAEAEKLKLKILPPHINKSEPYFTVLNGEIVFGLLGIKGVGSQGAYDICRERAEHGEYKSFMDFLERADLSTMNKKNIEAMIKAGCFDGLGQSRSCLMLNLDKAVSYTLLKKESKNSGQVSLFEDTGIQEFSEFKFTEMKEFPHKELLRLEKELTGCYISGHPLQDYTAEIERAETLDLSRLDRAIEGKIYMLVGMLASLRPYTTKSGKQMCFGMFEGLKGSIDLLFFASVWEEYKAELLPETVYGFEGKISRRQSSGKSKDGENDEADNSGSTAFIVEKVINIKDLKEKTISEIHIELDSGISTVKELEPLKEFIYSKQGGCGLFFHLEDGTKKHIIKASAQMKVPRSEEFMEELKKQPCVVQVWRE